MQKYADYTPAQAAWLDELPSHWQCTKIGALFSERKSKVSDKDYAPLSVARIGVVSQLATAVKTDAGDNRKLVCAGDFVINSRSDRKGSCGVAKLDGSVSLINIVLTPRNGLSERYVHYLLRSQPFSEEYYRNGRGIVADLWTTRYSEMKSILLPVPPREEQDQIVRFLDWKVSNINKLINIKKKEIKAIDALKRSMVSHAITRGLTADAPMKYSGVKWLGDIPQRWYTVPLYAIAQVKSINNCIDLPLMSVYLDAGVVPFVEREEKRTNATSKDLTNYQRVDPGDFVLNNQQAWRGSVGVSFHSGIVSPVFKGIVEAFGVAWTSVSTDYKIIISNLHSAKESVVRSVAKSEITRILDGSTTKDLSGGEISEIRNVISTESKWKVLKTSGFRSLPAGDATAAYGRLNSALCEAGIHLVPVGELECFIKTVGGHGPEWVNAVLETYPDLNDVVYTNIHDFIAGMNL